MLLEMLLVQVGQVGMVLWHSQLNPAADCMIEHDLLYGNQVHQKTVFVPDYHF